MNSLLDRGFSPDHTDELPRIVAKYTAAPIVVIFTSLFISQAFIQLASDDFQPYFDKVSGFYGPGTYWAWVINIVYVVATHEWKLIARALWRKSHGAAGSIRPIAQNIEPRASLDAGFISVILYPLICITHAFVCFVDPKAHSGSDIALYTAKAHIQAAVSVTAMAIFFAFPVLLHANITGSRHFTPWRERLWWTLCAGGFYLCLIDWMLHKHLHHHWAREVVKYDSILFAICVVLAVIIPCPRRQILSGLIAIWACTLNTIPFAANIIAWGGASFKGPMPRSGAKMSDLDQLATLGIGIVVTLYQIRNSSVKTGINTPGRTLSFAPPSTVPRWYGAS